MSPLAIPALVSLLFKAVLLTYALRTPRRDATTRLFMALLILFSVHNVVEFIGFNHLAISGMDQTMDVVGYLYFAIGIVFFAVVLHLSLRLSVDEWDKVRPYVWILYLPAPILEFLLLGTKQLVSGFAVFDNYTILRVPGPLYFLFETYAPLYLIAALVYLVYGARKSRPSAINRIRNRYWLVALIPFVFLNSYLIVANHLGDAKLSSSLFMPIAITFFLIVTTYATHQYRLFDIEFFIPWSKVRKRKSLFYQRIQAIIAEIADLKSVNEILDMLASALRCQVALIGGPRPVLSLANGQRMDVKSDLLVSEFPREALRNVNHIVVANEIEDNLPELYRLMKQHKVGAIVPFNAHSSTAGHWMLLGEHFSDQVYTPLDFKMVETLFDRIGERFLDNLLLLRSQLAEANQELADYQRRLTIAWEELSSLRKTLAQTEDDNRALREERAGLMRQCFRLVDGSLPGAIESGKKTLQQYLAESEREIVRAALRETGGNRAKTAKLLGMRPRTLHYLIQRHNIDPGESI